MAKSEKSGGTPEQPERAADAQPAAEEPVTNSEDAQEAVDTYKAGVANANQEETVVAAEPATEPAAPAPAPPPDENPVVERT